MYFKGAKIWCFFAQLYKNLTDCFVLKVSTVCRFQNKVCIASQEKGNKILYIVNEEMRAPTVDCR